MDKIVTDTLITVSLDEIRDIGWQTNPAQVAEMADILRQGKSLGTPILHYKPGNDDRLYEAIDGLHRISAHKLAEVPQFKAIRRDCDDHTAMIDRIKASVGKPADMLHTRAVSALTSLYANDILAAIKDKDLLAFELTSEAPGRKVVKRNEPLPEDPFFALLVFYNHDRAMRYVSPPKRDPISWEKILEHSLLEFAAQFGKNYDWIRGLVGAELFKGDTGGGAVWKLILEVGDEKVQRVLLRKRDSHFVNTAQYRQALGFLGTNLLYTHTQADAKTCSRVEAVKQLSAHTIQQLAKKANASKPTVEATLSENLIPSTENLESGTAIIGLVPSRWTQSPNTTPNYIQFHSAVVSLLQAGEAYERAGGQWSDEVQQTDLSMVLKWIQSHIDTTYLQNHNQMR